MRKLILLSLIVLCSVKMNSQEMSLWRKVDIKSKKHLEKIRNISYSNRQQFYMLNASALKQTLSRAKNKFSGQTGVEISLPDIEGNLENFLVWENSNFDPELQAKYPNIRAYVGKSITDKTATINFSVSPNGIQTMVLRGDNESEFIEPYTSDNLVYVLFDSKTRTAGKLPFTCRTIDKRLNQDILNRTQTTNRASNNTYKTLRLALSCTGEYGAYFGGVTNALAAMNATMTRVNGVMERDLAVHLNIIAKDDLVVYADGNTDPYSDAATGSKGDWNQELQYNLTTVFGNQAYDIGHLFGASGGGGNAGCIGCVCVDDDGFTSESKGSGFTSPSDNIPQGDLFDIDYVAHEMGHQLGAAHTFSYESESTGVQVEPGSGSTIMGYAGITDYDIQSHSDSYYTYRSILQIKTNLATKTCPVSTPITNSPPIVNAGVDFAVPAGTAYVLKGFATDSNGDSLTYCWEQNNDGDSQIGTKSIASQIKPSGPNYRSFPPKSTPNRYLPEFSKVLDGNLSTSWESVSTTARTLKFTLTVRNNHLNGSQTSSDEVIITSKSPYNLVNAPNGVGPFSVTSQNTTGISWTQGSSQIITWAVNNVTSLPGSATVNIKLSIDGGETFPYILASATLNDGTEVITVPSTPSASNCRILIEPTANVYYAVNSKAFAITGSLANDVFSLSNFNLYPNPNKGIFTVQFDSLSMNEIGISVSDMRGRNIFEKTYINTGLFSQNIALESVQKGIYLVTIKDGNMKVVKKIVVE